MSEQRPLKLNRRLLAHLRSVKESNGSYAWIPTTEKGKPSTLFGLPYEIIDEPRTPQG